MTRPSAAICRQVVGRATDCCEYCLVRQGFVASTHQFDHVIAEKHGGETALDNLALQCTLCNRRKGSDITSVDPDTGDIVSLFNPRTQRWSEHFEIDVFVSSVRRQRGERRLSFQGSTRSIDLWSGPNGLTPGITRRRHDVPRNTAVPFLTCAHTTRAGCKFPAVRIDFIDCPSLPERASVPTRSLLLSVPAAWARSMRPRTPDSNVSSLSKSFLNISPRVLNESRDPSAKPNSSLSSTILTSALSSMWASKMASTTS